VRLYELPLSGTPTPTIAVDGRISDYSVARTGRIAYAFTGRSDLAELQALDTREGAPRRLTDLNAELFREVKVAEVEAFSFVSNDFKFEVEAFLTKPLGRTETSRHPLVVIIHGGPHGQQGPQYNFRSQFFAHRGYATLQVNYRGSTGYGQKFADAVFADQNGNEAQDVLYGVSAALRRYLWLDPKRVVVEGVSYGGQLSAWLITQTHLFRAAIPVAGIMNNLSYNYTTYYNMYEQMEWGVLPHQGNLMDVLWERSALKHVAKVKTPTLLVHGENDNDVPIGESEQFYVALKDVGVEAVMVRYPREGHGLAEPKHIVDLMERSVAWYERHFAR
jgi:dipeptidyl aminopeptidase/acylaminoacyl peptidase